MGIERLSIAMFSIHSCPVGELGTQDTGGMNVYIRELANKLGTRGHRVDIYTRLHDPKDSQVIKLNSLLPDYYMGKVRRFMADFIRNNGI